MNKKELLLNLKKSLVLFGITTLPLSLVGCTKKEEKVYDMIMMFEDYNEAKQALNDIHIKEYYEIGTYNYYDSNDEKLENDKIYVYGVNYYDMVVRLTEEEAKKIENNGTQTCVLVKKYKNYSNNKPTNIGVYGIENK